MKLHSLLLKNLVVAILLHLSQKNTTSKFFNLRPDLLNVSLLELA